MKIILFKIFDWILKLIMKSIGFYRSTKNLNKDLVNTDDAIKQGDVDRINEIFKVSLVLILVISFTGCISSKRTIIYVPESEKIEKVEYNGKIGYFIPEIKMRELGQTVVRYKYYLKKYGPLE